MLPFSSGFHVRQNESSRDKAYPSAKRRLVDNVCKFLLSVLSSGTSWEDEDEEEWLPYAVRPSGH